VIERDVAARGGCVKDAIELGAQAFLARDDRLVLAGAVQRQCLLIDRNGTGRQRDLRTGRLAQVDRVAVNGLADTEPQRAGLRSFVARADIVAAGVVHRPRGSRGGRSRQCKHQRYRRCHRLARQNPHCML